MYKLFVNFMRAFEVHEYLQVGDFKQASFKYIEFLKTFKGYLSLGLHLKFIEQSLFCYLIHCKGS